MNTGVCKGLDAQSWKDLYQAAMCEPDMNKLPARIADAESALVMRCESRSTRLETNLKSRKVWTMPCPSFMPCVAH
jgi:hypothetical protein